MVGCGRHAGDGGRSGMGGVRMRVVVWDWEECA